MRLFGLEITRATKAAPAGLSTPSSRGGWFSVIRESFGGAWQRNVEWRNDDVLTFAAVFSCVTLIADDISKMDVLLLKDTNGIKDEIESPSFSPVLRKPNHFQTRIDFFNSWLLSLLTHGNTYVLKQRDNRGVVTSLYVLDPMRTRPMVAPNGDVYYAISQDDLAGVSSVDTVVPAEEMIHDRVNCLYHPLVGISPLTACGLAASQGRSIQNNQAQFHSNGSNPGGLLMFPGTLSEEEAESLQRKWESNYSGQNYGRVAVLGGDFKYQPLDIMSASDAQMIEQLRWTAENVCMAFRVPAYMINAGPAPNYNNVETLWQQYYAVCLQPRIESIELKLREGLALPSDYSVGFDLDALLRMDTTTRFKTYGEGVRGGLLAPNEGRRKLNLKPVPGGDSPYLQHQDHSLAALAKRDSKDDPFEKSNDTPKPKPESTPSSPADVDADTDAKMAVSWRLKSVQLGVG